jgi:hypothetical protein
VPSRGAIAKMKIDLRYTSNAQQNSFFALAPRIIFGGGWLAKSTPYSTEVLPEGPVSRPAYQLANQLAVFHKLISSALALSQSAIISSAYQPLIS